MATASPSRPLDDVMRERWKAAKKRPEIEFSADERETSTRRCAQFLTDAYWVWEDEEDSDPLAWGWITELIKVSTAAGQEAFEQHVVPAVAAAIKAHLSTAPDYLRVHPESETLRADLAALEGADR